jgi:hypothetical protein
MTSDDFLNQLRDGMQCRLLKRIPRASRLAAAEKLALLLSVCLAQSVERPPTALTTQLGPGSIPGADGLTQPSIPSG